MVNKRDAGRNACNTVVECHTRGGLPNFLNKLKRGQSVAVAYFGGSITQADGWRVLVDEWLRNTYPAAKISMVQAAIGGTSSDLGAFRLGKDVLAARPDLVFVEFAVNDSNRRPDSILLSMEGIVRHIWRAAPDCDICFVYTLGEMQLKLLRNGKLPRPSLAHEKVAAHYGIPSINFGPEVVQRERAGSLIFAAPDSERERLERDGKLVFSNDAVHPHLPGHRVYAEAVQRSFALLEGIGNCGAHSLIAPLNGDNWENATLVPFSECGQIIGLKKLSRADWPEISWSPERHSELWCGEKPGEGVTIRFNGTGIGVLDVIGPDTSALCVAVDGGRRKRVRRFDRHCLYRRTHYFIAFTGLPAGEHEVTFTLSPTPPSKEKILAGAGNYQTEIGKFTPNRWYPTAFLILGKPMK